MIGERGFWFNFLALITGEKADVAVIADTNVQLLMLPLQQFERILEEEPLYCKAITLLLPSAMPLLCGTLPMAR